MNEVKAKPLAFLSDGDLTMRPALEEDIHIWMRWLNDPDVTQFLHFARPKTLPEFKDWFQKVSTKTDQVFLVIVVDGVAIGNMALHDIDLQNRTAITGSVFGEKEYWGKGYGKRAKKLLLKYAFEELGLNKINSFVIEYNQRSVRYSLACGYKEEGRRREMYFRKGRFWDQIVLGITREDWQVLQK